MRKLAMLVAVAVMACTTYQDHLTRGQLAYQQNEYEQALAIWRVLERNMDSLQPGEQTRYAYLRGMTDYRLGFREDARHWLALAKALDEIHPGGLTGDWPQLTDDALRDLNHDVFGERMAAAETSAEGKQPAEQPQVEGFEPTRCTSDADCRVDESCTSGTCLSPPDTR